VPQPSSFDVTVAVLCCIVAADFEDLGSNLRSKDYGCQIRWGGEMIGEAEEVQGLLEIAPESWKNRRMSEKHCTKILMLQVGGGLRVRKPSQLNSPKPAERSWTLLLRSSF